MNRVVKKILYILQDLFIVCVAVTSVLGAYLMWTDPEYAMYMAGVMNRAFDFAQSPDGVTVLQKLVYTAPALLLSAVFVFDLAERRLFNQKRKQEA